MSKIAIDFMIKSIDSKQEFSTVGQIEENTITFIDPSKDLNNITLFNDEVVYQKSGSSNLHFVFHKHQPTKGTYQTFNYTFEFTVHVTDFEVEERIINIAYQLYQEEELVNEASLYLYYEFAKEE